MIAKVSGGVGSDRRPAGRPRLAEDVEPGDLADDVEPGDGPRGADIGAHRLLRI